MNQYLSIPNNINIIYINLNNLLIFNKNHKNTIPTFNYSFHDNKKLSFFMIRHINLFKTFTAHNHLKHNFSMNYFR